MNPSKQWIMMLACALTTWLTRDSAQATASDQPSIANTPPPAVYAFMGNKVVIGDVRDYRILAIGQTTRDGWTLTRANSVSATFTHSSGLTARVRAR